MTSATKTHGSTGYSKPTSVDKAAAGKNNEGMRQTYKQTGNVQGMKPHGNMNRTGGNYGSHKGNPY